MNTIRFITKYHKIVPTKNPDYFTIRGVDLSECRTYTACITADLASRLKVYSADELTFTFATGKADDGTYKCYLNRVDYEGGVIYDGYNERKKS